MSPLPTPAWRTSVPPSASDSGRCDGGGGRAGCAAAGEDDQQAVAAGMGERWDEDRGKEGQRN